MQQIISYQEVARLAFPLIISQAVILLSGMIDLAFIGPYGTAAIAAVSIANALCATLFNFCEGFRLGTTVLIAKASAAGDKSKVTAVINSGLLLAALIGLVLLVGAPVISNAVYGFAGDRLVAAHGVDYLKVWLWTIPVILWNYVLVGLFRGLRDTRTPLYSTLVICLLNIFFAYAFVYGGLGFPRLGVKGAAWATMLANFIGLLLLIGMATAKPLTKQYLSVKHLCWRQLTEYISLAVDVGLNTGFTLLALLIFVGMIKPLGAAALAVHQITLQVFNFAYLPAVGFLITASILVPRLLEQKQEYLVMPTVSRIGKLSFGVIFVISGLLYISAPAVSNLFSPADKTVAQQTAQVLKLICFAQLFSSLYMVLRGALTGCNDTRFIVWEGLGSGYLVFLPLAYLFAIYLGYGVYGGYVAFLLWCITDCCLLVWRFYYHRGWGQRN